MTLKEQLHKLASHPPKFDMTHRGAQIWNEYEADAWSLNSLSKRRNNMTDAMSDVVEYWDDRCNDCERKDPNTYNKCTADGYRNTWHCLTMGK